MTPEQLKASILQQAMEGKLVKQDPRDEPASVLVKKIADGKARLIKEKKIKRTKKLPAITNDEKPFDIPDSWEWVHLDEISYSIGGKSNQIREKDSLATGKYKVVSQSQKKFIGFTNESSKVLSPQTDCIVFGDHTALVKYIDFNFVIGGDGVKVFKTLPGVSTMYLYYVLKYNLIGVAGLGGYSRHFKYIKDKLIPLPPLSEQKRIVAKIEKLMPLVDKYAESYNQLTKIDANFNDRMKQSILQYAMEGKLVKQDLHDEPASVLVKQITDEKARLIKEKKIKRTKKLPAITNDEKPFDIPDSWEWVHLDEISYSIGGKSNQIREKDSLATGKYKVVSQSQKKFIGFTNESSKVLSPQTDCIVFGDHTALVKYIDFNFVIGGDGVKVFKTLPGVSTMYLYYVLKYNLIGVAGLGGYSRHFKYIKDKLIPLPPLSEQKRIVDKIEQFMKLLDDKTL